MTMKKTDLYKALAKKIGRDQKAERTPERFGKAAKATTPAAETATSSAPAAPSPKPVQVTLRLPAALVAQLRERALAHEGGISGVVADALDKHLQPAKPARAPRKKAAATPAADA